MENLGLTYKLIALKIKSKSLDRIYFMSQVFEEKNVTVMTKRKNKKIKTTKIYLILLPPLPSQGGGGGGGGCCNPHPTSQLFSRQKTFENFFHRYMGIWTKGG